MFGRLKRYIGNGFVWTFDRFGGVSATLAGFLVVDKMTRLGSPEWNYFMDIARASTRFPACVESRVTVH